MFASPGHRRAAARFEMPAWNPRPTVPAPTRSSAPCAPASPPRCCPPPRRRPPRDCARARLAGGAGMGTTARTPRIFFAAVSSNELQRAVEVRASRDHRVQHARHLRVDAITRLARDDVRAVRGLRRLADDAEIRRLLELERSGRQRHLRRARRERAVGGRAAVGVRDRPRRALSRSSRRLSRARAAAATNNWRICAPASRSSVQPSGMLVLPPAPCGP